jgi:hypothetical protein
MRQQQNITCIKFPSQITRGMAADVGVIVVKNLTKLGFQWKKFKSATQLVDLDL